METINFKTTLKCDGCVAKIKPVLEETSSIKTWNVDLSSAEKTLTVEGENIDKDKLIADIKEKGFTAEPLS
ncbi:MAG TPA: heavy-metal-associated domain-containing protein [Candidatus Sphingobacterium stercoripullorum]|uniref:Heavy-metal-associated domain-containing protein n=1 Tax=Candidatus Sphingobacterium stercoripullorum TaxID=2838759 RepID=A0A9D2AZP4_9SPHI|nr:heavy-metal-associated domain-containing protein [Candidatus Sphingobacterium stercoripullorum]HLR50114.1 heavy-metal-associated domain-containing protein [Candidatus Sphingobacterium stercoripullorum]